MVSGQALPFQFIQNLIKTIIFKLMALCDTFALVSDSKNFGLLFPVVCFVFVSDLALYELSYSICDKGP